MKPIILTQSRLPGLVSFFFPVVAITLGPFIFCKDKHPDSILLAHEKIHVKQWTELLIVGFPVLYVVSWVVALLLYRNAHQAYLAIPFEQEAREYAWKPEKRRMFGWATYDI